MDNFTIPSQQQGLQVLVNRPDEPPIPKRSRQGGYLDSFPVDPWGNDYIYEVDLQGYDVYSLGRDGVVGGDGGDADWHSFDLKSH